MKEERGKRRMERGERREERGERRGERKGKRREESREERGDNRTEHSDSKATRPSALALWRRRRIAVTEREKKISEFCFDRTKGIHPAQMHSTPASAVGQLPCVENQRCTRASAYLRVTGHSVSRRLDIVRWCNFHCTGQQHTPKVSLATHNSTRDLRTDEHYQFCEKGKKIITVKKSRFLSNIFDRLR